MTRPWAVHPRNFATNRLRKTLPADAIAGISVALVLLPQALAYADLAGLPPWRGLLAAGLPPLVASVFASSPWLQTGPTAITALLCYGALAPLAPIGSIEHAGLAALLAILVGLIRAVLGRMRAGVLAALLSQSVLVGFTLAAALLIFASQVPGLFDVQAEGATTLRRAAEVLSSPARWRLTAPIAAAITVVLVLGSARVHRLFPGVLVAVLGGALIGPWLGYQGSTLGELPSIVPSLAFDLPWTRLDELLLPALVLAIAGFAEVAAVSQRFAERERVRWNPDRELFAQGVGNITSGLVGGMPVGGSFARSSLGHLSGGRTRLAGAIAGAAILLSGPFISALATLPRAVLAGIVVAATRSLFDPRPLLKLWRLSQSQAVIAAWTFCMTLALAPRVELGLLAGMAVAVAIHLWRELDVLVDVERSGHQLTVRPHGVLWFGSAPRFRQRVADAIADHADISHVDFDLAGLGRLDLSGALVLRDLLDDLLADGTTVCLHNTPPQLERVVDRVAGDLRAADDGGDGAVATET